MKRFLCLLSLLFVAGVAHANDTVTNASNKLIVACDSSTLISAGNGVTRLITGAPNRRIYICGYTAEAQSGQSFTFRYGTAGSTCGTSIITLMGNVVSVSSATISYGGGLGTVFQPSPPGNEFCINNSASGNLVNGVVTWTQL